jgi:hypothetical protein
VCYDGIECDFNLINYVRELKEQSVIAIAQAPIQARARCCENLSFLTLQYASLDFIDTDSSAK